MKTLIEGYIEVNSCAVFYNPNTGSIVVLGTPDEEDEGCAVPKHNCDEMGCGSMDHVLLRGRVVK